MMSPVDEAMRNEMARLAKRRAQLQRYLSKHHTRLFKSDEAQDYVLVEGGTNGDEEPTVHFFADKRDMLKFADELPVFASGWRYSRDVIMML